MWESDQKESWNCRIDAFELWCWRRLLRVPWTARRSNQSILKRSVLNTHWKDWCWCWSSITLATWCESQLIGKDPDAGKDWGLEEKGTTEDGMVGWHPQLNGHEFEQTPEDSAGHGSLMCWSSWGRKESDMTEQLNNNKVATKNLLELINQFCKFAKLIHWNQLYFYTLTIRKEIIEKSPLSISSRRIKYPGINLPKEAEDLCSENCKMLMKAVEDATNGCKDILCHLIGRVSIVFKSSILSKWLYSPKKYTDTMQSLSIYWFYFS